jgi:NADPH-dependent 2,4-dienoyl-CoA reductase/sulfur reductase-like enzyme
LTYKVRRIDAPASRFRKLPALDSLVVDGTEDTTLMGSRVVVVGGGVIGTLHAYVALSRGAWQSP